MTLDELLGLGHDYPERYEAALKGVTPQKIQALAGRLFVPDRATVLIGVPRAAQTAALQAETVESS